MRWKKIMIEALPFGPGALVVVAVYVLSLLGIGFYAYKQRQKDNMQDFFLAGRSLGFTILFLTLYATQYSGNTLLGFSGATYRNGLSFLVCVHFMTAIVVCYLLFAPQLYRLSRQNQFLTPGDFIFHRYQNQFLRILVTLIMVYALANFTLAQMRTLGTAFAGISQGRIPMWAGVIGLALVMLIYESLGGMRSVAWTDAIQGGMLLAGFTILIGVAFSQFGSLPEAIEKLAGNPDTLHKIKPPDGDGARNWMSFVLLVGLGAAIYPQAIQRVYAARNVGTLKRSLAVMAFMPLVTALVSVMIGLLMAAHLPDLEKEFLGSGTIPSETVLTQMCLEIMQQSVFGYWLVVILFSSLLAAVMSTADSALLSISSMITHDIYGQTFRPDADQAHLTRIGKSVTWILMIPLVWAALVYEGNLIQLLKIKFELLIQCVPAIYLGVHCKSLNARTVITGMIVGLAVTLGMIAMGWSRVSGIHSGIIGLAFNLAICFFSIFKAVLPGKQSK
ncbi:MAG: sodium:solute symporter family protein [Nitrospinae bacterium]|nr:sodium:solute symporter family protein [Nitrospinota bacterium]MZH03919.1 sodium:solute symporter family protein [Nitrospinota bacterium]